MKDKQHHINFFPAIWRWLAEDMNDFILHLNTLKTIKWVKDRVSNLTDTGSVEDNELKEIQKLKFKLYNKFLDDLEKIYSKKDWKILMQIPSTHAKDFIPLIIERKYDKKSVFSELDLEYVIVDTPSVSEVSWKYKNHIKRAYEKLSKKAEEADKFIQIVDEADVLEILIPDKKWKKRVRKIEANHQQRLRDMMINKPKLRLYFPTEKQANLEDMSLKEFYSLYEKACSLDWKRIETANEELAILLRNYDEVEIKWPNSNIKFNIENMWAKNSVIQTNYPWSEVFTAPNKTWVNWWIKFDNEVYLKIIWESVNWLKLDFKNWRLENIDIDNSSYEEEEKNRLLKLLKEKIFNNERNRYLWELAFWTNFFIPVWIKHRLIWEKAIWMHIALWNAYKKDEVNNWNQWADFHQDLIRDMQDWSIVTFRKKSWKEIEVMNNWVFNPKTLPKLAKYQEEVNKTISKS